MTSNAQGLHPSKINFLAYAEALAESMGEKAPIAAEPAIGIMDRGTPREHASIVAQTLLPGAAVVIESMAYVRPRAQIVFRFKPAGNFW